MKSAVTFLGVMAMVLTTGLVASADPGNERLQVMCSVQKGLKSFRLQKSLKNIDATRTSYLDVASGEIKDLAVDVDVENNKISVSAVSKNLKVLVSGQNSVTLVALPVTAEDEAVQIFCILK